MSICQYKNIIVEWTGAHVVLVPQLVKSIEMLDVAAPVAATVSQLVHVVINVKDSVTVSF